MNLGLGYFFNPCSLRSSVSITTYGSTSSTSFSNHFFLCFGGHFLLSSITRVFAGTIPDFRATRRASVPFSNFFFLAFLICPALQPTSHCRCVPYRSLRKLLPGR